VSKSAQKKLWPSLSAWWAQREGGRSVIEAKAEVVSEATGEKKPAIALRVAEAEGDGHGANGAASANGAKRAKKKAEAAR
jgi:hypothetical protein